MIGDTPVKVRFVVAVHAAAEHFIKALDQDRSSIERADDDARDAGLRIDQRGAEPMRELAGLAAGLDVAPLRRSCALRYMDADQQLTCFETALQRAGDEGGDCELAGACPAPQRHACAERR